MLASNGSPNPTRSKLLNWFKLWQDGPPGFLMVQHHANAHDLLVGIETVGTAEERTSASLAGCLSFALSPLGRQPTAVRPPFDLLASHNGRRAGAKRP
jgi:hypothetical protein